MQKEALELVRTKLDKARKMVSDLSNQRKEWILSIPADPVRDPDLVISAGLDAADEMIKKILEFMSSPEMEPSPIDFVEQDGTARRLVWEPGTEGQYTTPAEGQYVAESDWDERPTCLGCNTVDVGVTITPAIGPDGEADETCKVCGSGEIFDSPQDAIRAMSDMVAFLGSAAGDLSIVFDKLGYCHDFPTEDPSLSGGLPERVEWAKREIERLRGKAAPETINLIRLERLCRKRKNRL